MENTSGNRADRQFKIGETVMVRDYTPFLAFDLAFAAYSLAFWRLFDFYNSSLLILQHFGVCLTSAIHP
ncbi:hypothetical protein T06_13385 [Trichinella sp. T6]|nr:hypothetical protein T06_13385 [Trichinella sp. T6]